MAPSLTNATGVPISPAGPIGVPGSLDAMKSYLEAVRERVVIFDGATGTNLQRMDLTADDFGRRCQ